MRHPHRWLLRLMLFPVLFGFLFAQEKAVDPRIWSTHYWQQMAERGLVEVAKEAPVPAAQYTGSAIHAPTVRDTDSPDVPVTTDPNTTQSENSIFVNPLDNNKVLNSNNSTNFPVSVIFGTSGFETTDGGLTWGGQIQGTGGNNSGDPAAAINLNGRYYVNYIAANGGNGTAHSTDEGTTWTHVQVAPNPGSLADKNHMWVDNSPSSPFAGNVYAAWTDFGGPNDSEIAISRSTDNGLTWSPRISISNAVNAGSHNQGVNVQTGPNGEVYVAWAIYDAFPADETAIGFTKSTDGGATFAPATRIITNIRGIRNTGTPKNHRTASFPVMAVDISGGSRNGWIYIVWTNVGTPGINTGPDTDNYIVRSTDGGATWSTPVRINQDPAGLGKIHYFPWITCDPITGALSVVSYDDRNVSATQDEVFVANSLDGGSTWDDFKVSDVAFTPAPIPGLAGGYMGDYLAISARGGKVYPCWTDNRTGTALTYVSPFTLADPTDPNPPSGATIYSDFTTPTSMQLTWTDPTNYTNGDTLLPANFTIEIQRDGVFLTSVASGVEQFTDNGLTDGQQYTYTLNTKDNVDSLSLPVNLTWIAGGSPIPSRPTNFFVTEAGASDLMMHWTNPATNVDGTPMDDFGGINLYQDGSLVTTFLRTTADTGRVDSAMFTPPSGTHQYFVTAVDVEFPNNESAPSNVGFTPIRLPFFDDFPTGPDPNDGFWINTTANVNNFGVNPPSAPLVLNLDGDPSGGETVTLLPVNTSSLSGSGALLSFWYQPQGTGNAPESTDSLAVDFRNDLGQWITVRHYPGTTVVPFVNEVVSLDAENPGAGATFFYPQFQFRFRNLATTGAFDNWLIDNVFLGVPSASPQMVVDPQTLVDTLLVGASSMQVFTIANINPTPSTLNFTVTETPDVPWLSVSPTSGSAASGQTVSIDVSLDATGLAAGDYTTDLIVAGNDSSNLEDTVTVNLRVNDAPVIGLNPDTLNFALNGGQVDSATLSIVNSGAGPLHFTLDDEDIFVFKFRRPALKKQYPASYYSMDPGKKDADPRQGRSPQDGLGGPDAFGHRWIDSDEPGGPIFNWNDITGSGTPIVLTDDSFLEVPISFPFSFYGVDKSLVKISSNGYLTFGIDGTDFSNDPIPSTIDPNDFIAPFWDDLNPADGGTVHYLDTGNEFIVQYTNIPHFGGGGVYTFQVILRNNGQILYQYLTMTGTLNSATIGIENVDASDGLEVVFNANYVHDNLAVRIAADSPWLSENPTSGTVPGNSSMDVQVIANTTGLPDGQYAARVVATSNDPVTPEISMVVNLTVGNQPAPAISVVPDSIGETLQFGDSTDVVIEIGNTGSADLHWQAQLVTLDYARFINGNRHRGTAHGDATATGSLTEFNDTVTGETGPPNINLIPGFRPNPRTDSAILYDNGPLINSVGTGVGGADESVLQSVTLGMNTLGFGHQFLSNNHMADDFTVTGSGWQVDQFTFFAYQTNSPTTSTITGVYYQIWDGSPDDPNSTVVFGDLTTNRLLSTAWTNIYRVTETTTGTSSARPIMANVADAGVFLAPGTYWVEWMTDGSLASGPWAPPVTINGQATTGNALQFIGSSSTWGPANDSGSLTQQGMPFIIEGSSEEPFIELLDPLSGTVPAGDSDSLTVRLFATVADTVLSAAIEITSDDPAVPSFIVPVTLTVGPIVGIEGEQTIPTRFAIEQNYPNPFNPSTTISYQLPKAADVKLVIYNLLGQKVKTLVNSRVEPGRYQTIWDGRNDAGATVSSGIYIYRFEAADFTKVKKMILLK